MIDYSSNTIDLKPLLLPFIFKFSNFQIFKFFKKIAMTDYSANTIDLKPLPLPFIFKFSNLQIFKL